MHLLQFYDTVFQHLEILVIHFIVYQDHDPLYIRQRDWNNSARCGRHGKFYRSKPNILSVNSCYEFSLPDTYSLR